MSEEEDLLCRASTKFWFGNIIVNPLSGELHIVGSARILYIGDKLMVDYNGHDSPICEEVANVGVTLPKN